MSKETETQLRAVNYHCVDCNKRIEDIPKKRVNFNFMRCKECYKNSVTFVCQYPCCKQKLRSTYTKFCTTHEIKSKAEKKEALARAMDEKRRKKLELPDPFQDSWNNYFFSQSSSSASHFHSEIDMFEIYAVLNVSPNFTKHDLRIAYKQKARELHPDKNTTSDTTEQFQNLQVIYKQALVLLGDKELSN
jgi:hypothetical protein